MNNLIGKNEELLNLLIDNMSILDGNICKIAFYDDSTLGVLTAEFHMELAYRKPKASINLKFIGVDECSFYYQKIKFFIT